MALSGIDFLGVHRYASSSIGTDQVLAVPQCTCRQQIDSSTNWMNGAPRK